MHSLQDIFWITLKDGQSVLSLGEVDKQLLPSRNSFYVPVVPVPDGGNARLIDIPSVMAQTGIIYVYGPITSELAQMVIAQLEYHRFSPPQDGITLYIDSPGGSVTAGQAICDTIETLIENKIPVGCVVQGIAASMASVITAVCQKGMRKARKSSRIMIHEPSVNGLSGKFTVLKAEIDMLEQMFNELARKIADCCGQPFEKVKTDMLTDYWLKVPDAVAYGILDGSV